MKIVIIGVVLGLLLLDKKKPQTHYCVVKVECCV